MAPSLEHTVTNGVNATIGEFEQKDAPVENFRPMKVIVIGAGFSGIYCGIRIPQRLRNIDLTIYEKNEGVGGTWWENRYPGCACDVPGASHRFSAPMTPLTFGISAFLSVLVRAKSAVEFVLRPRS